MAAARIAPEWTDYDQEVKLIWDQIYGTSTAANSDATQGETTGKSAIKIRPGTLSSFVFSPSTELLLIL